MPVKRPRSAKTNDRRAAAGGAAAEVAARKAGKAPLTVAVGQQCPGIPAKGATGEDDDRREAADSFDSQGSGRRAREGRGVGGPPCPIEVGYSAASATKGELARKAGAVGPQAGGRVGQAQWVQVEAEPSSDEGTKALGPGQFLRLTVSRGCTRTVEVEEGGNPVTCFVLNRGGNRGPKPTYESVMTLKVPGQATFDVGNDRTEGDSTISWSVVSAEAAKPERRPRGRPGKAPGEPEVRGDVEGEKEAELLNEVGEKKRWGKIEGRRLADAMKEGKDIDKLMGQFPGRTKEDIQWKIKQLEKEGVHEGVVERALGGDRGEASGPFGEGSRASGLGPG
jgi:hypothetical protein